MEKSPQELCREREKRINEAIQLKVPDRVPFFLPSGLFPAKYVGMTYEEAFYDPEKWFSAHKKVNQDFESDLYWNPRFGILTSGQAFEAVDFKQLKWPGHGVSPEHSFQFVEGEYMKPEEYDAFLDDPSDYAFRTYLPRVCGTLAPLAMLPPLKSMLLGYAAVGLTAILAIPDIAKAFESLYRAGLEAAKWDAASTRFHDEMADLGFPPLAGDAAVSLAPFDLVSDFLRGMRGTMLDMYRRPEQLLQAIEKVEPLVINAALAGAHMSGIPRVFIPLHRGADGFMSNEQFETFYWPGLKKLLMSLINAGLTPCPIFEGCYDSRLPYLKELPKGKIFGMFDATDVFQAKGIIGDRICIVGNLPLSLLQTGTLDQIRDYSKRLIEEVGRDGGFIMSARAALDEADPERVKAWADFTKEYGVYG